jgi:hypothetical protein
VVAGLRPDRFEVPYQPDLDDGPLRWAAAPVLDQVADELEGAGVGLLLTDARGQVVDRRAADTGILTRLDRIELAPGFLYGEDLIGTNAIGTAIAKQASSVVTGAEHFADALTSMACAAIPVTDDGAGGTDPDGSGLTGLRERTEALGGALKLTSPPGRGTSVDVKLPGTAR